MGKWGKTHFDFRKVLPPPAVWLLWLATCADTGDVGAPPSRSRRTKTAISVADTMTDTQYEYSLANTRSFSPSVSGAATEPGASDCAVTATSGPVANASCTCASGTCTVTYDTTGYTGSSGQIALSVNDGSGNVFDTGQIDVTVKDILRVSVGLLTACFLNTDNKIACSGNNQDGQLGNWVAGTYSAIPNTTETGAAVTFKDVAGGAGTTFCAVTTDNKVMCWGSDATSETGNGPASVADVAKPTQIDMTSIGAGIKFTRVALSGNGACAVTTLGKIYCWGQGGATLGINDGAAPTATRPATAVDESNLTAGSKFTQIAAGTFHFCALADDGKAYCWGSDTSGQVGDGPASQANKNLPTAVDTSNLPAGVTFTKVSAGNVTTCALATNGKIYCWGIDTNGELGNDNSSQATVYLPVAVNTSGLPAGVSFSDFATGYEATCAIATNQKVYCWGSDASGALGNGAGTVATQYAPAVALDTTNTGSEVFESLSGGYQNFCGVTDSRKFYCWGRGAEGIRGDLSTSDAVIPIQSKMADTNKIETWGGPELTVSDSSSSVGTTLLENHISPAAFPDTCSITGSLNILSTTCHCDGSLICSADSDFTGSSAGAAWFTYTLAKGAYTSSTGRVDFIVNNNAIIASDVQVDNSGRSGNTSGLSNFLSVGTAGSAAYPNACVVDSYSPTLQNVSCSCDGSSNCSASWDMSGNMDALGASIQYTASNGVESDSGVLTINIDNYLVASDYDTTTQSENQSNLSTPVTVSAVGSAVFPNTGGGLGMCVVTSVSSGTISGASCSCDGASCNFQYDTLGLGGGGSETVHIDYVLTDGSYNFTDPGRLDVTVTP